jgi:hypothetical protein
MEETRVWEDLEVEVGRGVEGALEVRILRSPFNRPRACFAPPFPDGGARRKWREIDGWIQSYLRAKRDPAKCPALDVEGLGKQLFDVLFPEPLRSTLARADGWAGEAGGLRIRLSFDISEGAVNEGAVLPWELAWSPIREEFLALDHRNPFVRYIDSNQPRRSLDVAPPLRVLLVAANPGSELDLEKERRAILAAVGDSSVLELEVLAEPTLESLKARLDQGELEVLHFMGHGGFDEQGGFLVFESAAGGERGVTDRVLANLLPAEPTLRLVVLAACEGAQVSRRDGSQGLYGVAAGLTRRGLAVVGMQFVVSDKAAAWFSGALYRSLVRGELLEEAVTQGRRTIFHEDQRSLEWASPVLFLGVPEGRLVKLPKRRPTNVVEEPEGDRLLGIFSMGRDRWGKDALDRVEYPLDLSGFFKPDHDGRYIRNDALWSVVGAEVARFLPGVVSRSQTNVLEMAAHLSIAYAAGRSLEAMAGYELVLRQRSADTSHDWRLDEGEVPDGLWPHLEDRPLHPEGQDMALVVSITQPATEVAAKYLKAKPEIGRLLVASLGAKKGQLAIKSGAHAFELAQALFQWVREKQSRSQAGPLHLFIATPGSFAFFLGRLTRDWGEVQLYEHDRDNQMATLYFPSFRVGGES